MNSFIFYLGTFYILVGTIFLTVPIIYLELGKPKDLMVKYGLDSKSIVAAAEKVIGRK